MTRAYPIYAPSLDIRFFSKTHKQRLENEISYLRSELQGKNALVKSVVNSHIFHGKCSCFIWKCLNYNLDRYDVIELSQELSTSTS